MNEPKLVYFLIPALAFGLSLSAAQPDPWSTYHDERFGYELRYPTGWNVVESRSPGVLQQVTFQEPEGPIWPGEFVIRVHEPIAGQTLDEWADTSFVDVHDESLVAGVEDTVLAGRAARLFHVFGFDQTRTVVALVRDRHLYEIGYTGSTPNDPNLATHRSIYDSMKQSFRFAPSPKAKVFDLGGPCDDGPPPADYYKKFADAARQGDRQQMIDLQKHYVRAMCSNHNRWYGLAETYLGADRPDMAIRVLHELHRRGAEIKPSTFRDHPSLASLIDTPEFQQSGPGRELRELHAAATRRKTAHRARLAALDAPARAPEPYVARGACPFECCSYREWEVLETTALYDAPFGNVVVGSAIQGSKVRGVTGDVHLRPAPVAVVHDHPPFVSGEIVFLLDYIGEGLFRYWRDGVIGEEDLWVDEVCLRPSRNCWAEYIEAADERREPRWWVLIETGEGVRGWTDRPERFGGKDACG